MPPESWPDTGASPWDAEVNRRIEQRFAAARNQGHVLYELFIDADDTSTDEPELWCVVLLDTDEEVGRRLSMDDVNELVARHPAWIDAENIRDDVQDTVREEWANRPG